MDNSPSPIMILNENGVIVETSPAAETILSFIGANEADQEGWRIAPTIIREKIKDVIKQMSGESTVFEKQDVFEKSGIKLVFESRMFPIYDPRVQKPLFGYLALDITENIAAQNALKESEEKYSNYVQNAPHGIFVVNSEGRYVDANPAATAITAV
ncbi:MAG: PAS domain-containing protein [Eubacteriales bacterium]